jgi:serine/threonine protein kinase
MLPVRACVRLQMLSSEVYPASDVWAAGVMAYQLLSGRMPFEDWRNPRSPALSQLWWVQWLPCTLVSALYPLMHIQSSDAASQT